MAEDERRSRTTSGGDVRVSLRGADIAPIKAATTKNLVYLQRRLMREGDRIEADNLVETMIIDNGLGTMHGFVDALKERSRDEARARWNEWWAERKRTPNRELFVFAQRSLVDITFDLKDTGMLDLREKPKPRHLDHDLTGAFEGMQEVEGAAAD